MYQVMAAQGMVALPCGRATLRALNCAGTLRPVFHSTQVFSRGYRLPLGQAGADRMREEVLEKQFTELLGLLKFDNEVLAWVREALHASHADERHEHEEAIRRLQGEHRRLGDRINVMYVDKLDGRVDGAFFDKMSAEWREEQNRCLREIERHEAAEQSYMDEGVQILCVS
jgi:hypothetical protein